MKQRYYIAIIAFAAASILHSCTKHDTQPYSAFAYIKDMSIRDVHVANDSTLIVAGEDAVGNGVIEIHNPNTKKGSRHTFIHSMAQVQQYGSTLWACGDSMTLVRSDDFGATWTAINDFTYFWDFDFSNLTKMCILQNTPAFAIGNKDMIHGIIYTKNTNPYYPLKRHQPFTGLNDMLTVDSSVFYIAGYGSVLRIHIDTDSTEYEKIGGEYFTSICNAGTENLICCSSKGNIYTKKYNSRSETWNKVYAARKDLRFIRANSKGEAVAFGKHNTMYVSKDYGDTWTPFHYKGAKNASSLTCHNDTFYIGFTTGEIQIIQAHQLK